jgi:hypothetical protein
MSKIFPGLICAQYLVHFGSRSPLSDSRTNLPRPVIVLQKEHLRDAKCASEFCGSIQPSGIPGASHTRPVLNCSPRRIATATRIWLL